MTALGTEALHGLWSGEKNTGVGYRALYSRQGGTLWATNRNTAVGDSAMAYVQYSSNTAIGTEALSRGLFSAENVAIGDSSMGGAINTFYNVAIGNKTLSKLVGQGGNTAVGYYSQRDSSVNTIYNTSIGAYSMEYNRTGIYNTGLGLSALRFSDSASYNTVLVADAMYNHRRNLPTNEQGYGFSAQEVQKIFPEAVKEGKDGFLSLDMHPILVSYINAFKEQQQIIDNQQKAIEELLKRVEKLEKK